MNYCVLIKISKQKLAFWYQLEGGAYTPLSINGPNKMPLCFYVNGNEFKIGEFAKERFLVNDKNAYCDYFELVRDPAKQFILHGDSKPIKQLLYYGVENYLSHFIKTILYKNESIEAFRTNFCLRFWFDDDIESQEKILVENLFSEAGYENVAEINSNLFLNDEISLEIKSTRSRLCLSAISNDLYVKLYKSPDFSVVGQIKLEQLGSDPRAKILAKLILEDIKEANPHIYIEEEKEIAFIINHCAQLLSSLSPIMRNELELSTGVRTDYKIRLAHLEDRLMYNRGVEDKVIPQLESILSANGMSSSSVDIILNGDELNTNYFKDRLNKKFSNVFGVGSLIESKLLKLIFSDISSNVYKLNPNIKLGHIEKEEKAVPVSKIPPLIDTPPVAKTSPVVNTHPVAKTPPVVKFPIVPNKNNVTTTENKPEVKLPPIIKPEVKVPPVIKEEKKVDIPPPLKGKIPPPPPPPPRIKKK
ncbi:MAG: hypothetical protein RL728_162 [Bacteroidota bacterium]|jgi:hypothetical protein